jgi:hypothetical protein
MKAIFKKSILWWLPLPAIGMLNGMFRGFLLNRIFPDFVAHQFSSLLMIVWILLYIEAVYGKLNYQKSSDAWLTGLTWVVLTVAFEFILGYFILGSSVQSMLAEYNLLEGRFWVLVLVSILVSPILYFKLGDHDPVNNSREKTA